MFAVVKFTKEKDAPGVISTNWIKKDDPTISYFPNVQTEFHKNKLLFARVDPKEDWRECPIEILGRYGEKCRPHSNHTFVFQNVQLVKIKVPFSKYFYFVNMFQRSRVIFKCK